MNNTIESKKEYISLETENIRLLNKIYTFRRFRDFGVMFFIVLLFFNHFYNQANLVVVERESYIEKKMQQVETIFDKLQYSKCLDKYSYSNIKDEISRAKNSYTPPFERFKPFIAEDIILFCIIVILGVIYCTYILIKTNKEFVKVQKRLIELKYF